MGVELKQGHDTKMVSIAAEVLGCSINRIRISETSTDQICDIRPAGGSDLHGVAIRYAFSFL
jgi:xanthine dehydrogenase molybdopterin-binding subunit B